MKFPSKILLFGEYNLLIGGSAVSIPYKQYYGEFTTKDSPLAESYNQSIFQLLKYLKASELCAKVLNLSQLEADLQKGMWFDSNIPNGYGLGSSGALVAAVYHQYGIKQDSSLQQTQLCLSAMESYYHGSSSGLDPLVSYKQMPLVVKNGAVRQLDNWEAEKSGYTIYLVDTAMKSSTISLVDWFKAQMQKELFKQANLNGSLLPVNSLVEQIERGEHLNFDNLKLVSRYQLEYLSPMVTNSFRIHYYEGLNSDSFVFKLCGSGGGGFMLCFAQDENKAEQYFQNNSLAFQRINHA